MALLRVSVSLERGTVTGLVGVNGSGKSTLLKTIMGLVHLDQGSVRIAGQLQSTAARAGVVAYVPQSEAVDWDFPLSVRDVVTMGRYGRMAFGRRARSVDIAAVEHALERVGLTELAHRPIGALSGGQRKRAFIARALAQEASILLLDEPFAGVDRGSQATMIEVLRQLATHGVTTLAATHDLESIPRLCDGIVLLRNRVILHAGVAEALSPANLALALGLDTASRSVGGT